MLQGMIPERAEGLGFRVLCEGWKGEAGGAAAGVGGGELGFGVLLGFFLVRVSRYE